MSHELQAALVPRKALATFTAAVMVLGSCVTPAFGASKPKTAVSVAFPTATPIQHLVVIFDENISFDHYFGTYPVAVNPPGEPSFKAAANTPNVNGLTHALVTFNPNLNPANGVAASNPFRLQRSQAVTGDQDHGYRYEVELRGGELGAPQGREGRVVKGGDHGSQGTTTLCRIPVSRDAHRWPRRWGEEERP